METYQLAHSGEALDKAIAGRFVTEELTVTENGPYAPGNGVDGFSKVDVNVQPPLEELTVSKAGIYTPAEGVYGFSKVNAEGYFPELIYETTFEIAEDISGGSGTLCTISTGLSDTTFYENSETLMATIAAVNPTTGYTSSQQPIYSNYNGFFPSTVYVLYRGYNDVSKNTGEPTGMKLSNVTTDLSSLTVYYRANTKIIAGIYAVKIFRTGFKNAKNY